MRSNLFSQDRSRPRKVDERGGCRSEKMQAAGRACDIPKRSSSCLVVYHCIAADDLVLDLDDVTMSVLEPSIMSALTLSSMEL